MAVSENGFLVGLFVFLCLSLTSAHRVLKGSDAENGMTANDLPSGHDEQLLGTSHAGLKGGMPKFSSVGPTSGDCCNYGSNCGQNGYGCPPSYGCGGGNCGGGNSGCQSCGGGNSGGGCYSCPPCQWQGCQGCQGSPPPCGCEFRIDNSKVQDESTVTSEPDPPSIVDVPQVQPENHNKKSSGGANQDRKSNGGMV